MISQILQTSLIPTFVIDNNHIITYWNKGCERLTGLTADEMIGTGKQWCTLYSKEKLIMADLIVDNVPKEEAVRYFGDGFQKITIIDGAYEAEGFFPAQGEKGKWLFITASPLKNNEGKIAGAIQTLQDITAAKQAEEALEKTKKELEGRVLERTAELTLINADLNKEIAERKHVEETLRLSENKFRTVADFTYDWEYWIDPDGCIAYTSPACERITGYETKEFRENADFLAAITHPDDRAEILNHFKKEIKSDRVSHMDFRIITREGEERWISHSCLPVFDEDGNHLGRRASNRDITKRKQMEVTLRKERGKLEIRVEERTEQLSLAYDSLREEMEARITAYKSLQESEEELRVRKEFTETILDNLPIGLAVGSISNGSVHYMNAAFTEIYGWPNDDLGSFDAFLDHVFPDPIYRKLIKKRVVKDIVSRDPSAMIWKNLFPTTKCGKKRVVTVRGIPLFEQDLLISTAQDVTEKYKANEALHLTRFSIDHANDMIYWVDPDGKIVDVNKTTCNKLGCSKEELLSMTMMDIDPRLTLDKFYERWEITKHHETWRVETSHYCKSGEAIPVEIHLNHIAFSGKEYNCVFARDITERRELERLVAIQDKMGSLGRVAAGIAHEIRNPLSTINVYLSTLKRLLADNDVDLTHKTSMQGAVEEMDRASHKIETVVKRVMDFSKPNQQRMRLKNVNHCVQDAVDLSVVTLRKSGITMDVQLDETLPECYIDCQLIEQVVLNLITNAREELIECLGEKQLEIKTAIRSSYSGEKSIVITVADSGPGVSVEVRNKIFDPFFTTKQYGSGIGLSICHRIISDHHGFLNIGTSRWGGAMFTAVFPVKKEVDN